MGEFPNEPCDKLEATFTHQKNTKPSRGQRERRHTYLQKFIQRYCTLKSLVPCGKYIEDER